MKRAAEVSLDEIFQKPIWFCFLTFGCKVSRGGGDPSGALNSLKILFFQGVGLEFSKNETKNPLDSLMVWRISTINTLSVHK